MFTVTLQLKYHGAPQLLSGVVSLGALSSAAQLQIVVQQGSKAHVSGTAPTLSTGPR